MVIKALYIDDEISRPGREAQKYKELLHLPGVFECDLQFPPKSFFDISSQFDAFLIDLDLSVPSSSGETVGYFGSTLASEIRMRDPVRPIILITRPNMIMGKAQLLEDSIDVDLIIFKDEINQDPDGTRAKIIALVEGFKALAAIQGQSWQRVLELMKADDDETNLLREAAPPVEHGQWNVPQVASWVRNVVMGFPGILYDDLTAATRLGIDLESFRKSDVQAMMEQAEYAGVFSTYKERWWRDRTFQIAQSLLLKHKMRGPIPEKFREAFAIESNKMLDPAVCIVDGTPTADWVCHIFKKPVKQRNSIPYYPDSRLSVMDQARVSFKAIQESDEFDESLVDADSYEFVKKLMRGE